MSRAEHRRVRFKRIFSFRKSQLERNKASQNMTTVYPLEEKPNAPPSYGKRLPCLKYKNTHRFFISRTGNVSSTSSTHATVPWNASNRTHYFSATRTRIGHVYVSSKYYEWTIITISIGHSYDHHNTWDVIRRCTNPMHLSQLLSTDCNTSREEERFSNMVNLWWNHSSRWLARLLSDPILRR